MATLSDLFVSYKSLDASDTKFKQEQERKEHIKVPDKVGEVLYSLYTRENKDETQTTPPITTTEETKPPYPKDADYRNKFQWFVEHWDEDEDLDDATTTPPYDIGHGPSKESYNRGQLDKELFDLFRKEGINVKITSGKRPAGRAGRAGKKSHHVYGNAVDIVPGKGETFDSIREKMLNSTAVRSFFKENGIGILEETTKSIMNRTGATGAHFHIGPDSIAVESWKAHINKRRPKLNITNKTDMADWTRQVYNAFLWELQDRYGTKYSDEHYRNMALWMTQQSAIESHYGKNAKGFNTFGHKNGDKVIEYSSSDDALRAHMNTLSKWPTMKARNLAEYVSSLYEGKYRYNAHDPFEKYYKEINGTTNRVKRYLGMSNGGKFSVLREKYEESFSKYRK